jgi:hypothetical protein
MKLSALFAEKQAAITARASSVIAPADAETVSSGGASIEMAGIAAAERETENV